MKKFYEYLLSLSNEERLDKVHIYLLLQSILDQWKLNRRADLDQTLYSYKTRYNFSCSPSLQQDEYNAPLFSLDFCNKRINVIFQYLRIYALPELNKRNLIGYAKTNEDKYYFVAIPNGLQEKLAEDNYAEFERILIMQIEKCLDPQKRYELAINSAKSSKNDDIINRGITTPLGKLSRRIARELKKVKLIGDVEVNLEEYQLLKDRFISCYKTLVDAGVSSAFVFDETFLVATVQIGIRCYREGRFWPEVERELGIDIPTYRHDGILHSFVKTAMKHNMKIFTEHSDIENILSHGFVSNAYLDSFFNFLFTYYRIDMERDMNQCKTAELVKAIIERNSHAREQLVRRHTQKAFSINTLGAKIRVRRIMRLMDRLFYDETFQLVSSSRIYSGLASWARKSTAFAKERESREYSGTGTKGLQMITSAYIKANYDGMQSFSIIIPTQLIRSEAELAPDNIFINVKTEDTMNSYCLEIIRDRGITGFRTEAYSIPILHEHLFSGFAFELTAGDSKIRSLPSIPKSDVRFFNEDGFLISGEKLRTGKIYAFSRAQDELSSSCIMDMTVFGQIRRSDFLLEEGDIVFLPSGKPVSAGKQIVEGISEKGIVRGINVMVQDLAINLYHEIPYVILKMKPDRMPNTIITINGRRIRASDIVYKEFSIDENTEERGFYIQLSSLGISSNGIYKLNISVPNDSTCRVWTFAFIHNFSFDFEGAPYYFAPSGCLSIGGCDLICPLDDMKLLGEHTYGFEILPGRTNLKFEVDTIDEKLIISVPIPALFWKMKETDEWKTKHPDDLWYNQLPDFAYFMCPSNEIELKIRDLPDHDDESQYIFTKSISKGYFICDLTKLKSKLDKRRAIWFIDFVAGTHEMELMKIGTKNVIIHAEIRPEYDRDGIICMIEYFGKNPVAFDIEFENNEICTKEMIEDAPSFVNASPKSGVYTVRIFELIESDLGFDDEYEELETIHCELVDPNDLSNKSIFLHKLIDMKLGGFELPLIKGNNIFGLKRISRTKYSGKLFCPTCDGNSYLMDAVVVFNMDGEESCYVQFTDEGDELDLEYDTLYRTLVQNEENGLSKKNAYLRYRLLYDQIHLFKYYFANSVGKRR